MAKIFSHLKSQGFIKLFVAFLIDQIPARPAGSPATNLTQILTNIFLSYATIFVFPIAVHVEDVRAVLIGIGIVRLP